MRPSVRTTLVFVAALAVKAAVLYALHDHPLLQPRGQLDPAVYIELAQRVAHGDVLLGREPYFVSPLYIYFLAAIFAAGGGILAARVVQILLGALAVVLIGESARNAFGPRAGWIASVLLMLTGGVTFYEVTLLQSSLDPILVALALFHRRDTPPRILQGIGAGLLVLNRPNALLWLGVFGVYLLWRHRRGAIPFVLAAVATIAPVTLRNWIVSGEPILVSSHGGLNLFIGNNEVTPGTYVQVEGIRADIRGQHLDAQRLAERAAGRKLTQREVSRHFTMRALDWMREHPLAAMRLFLRKLAYTFSNADIPLNHSYAFYAVDPPLLLLVVGPWLLFPLAAVALLRAPRAWSSFVVIYALSVALFFVSTRYRIPLLVAAAPLAGGGAVLLFERWRRVAVAIVAAIVVLWPHRLDNGMTNERAQLVFVDIAHGRVHDAIPRIEEIAHDHHDPSMLFLGTGLAFNDAGRREEAAVMFERAMTTPAKEQETQLTAAAKLVETYVALDRKDDAIRVARALDPDRLDAVHAAWVGKHALALQDAPTARAFLRRAAALRPESAEAHHNLASAYAMNKENAAAMQELAIAHRLDPKNPATLLNLAVLQAQSGDYAAARRNATEALRLRPGYAQAERLLAALP